MARKLSFQVHQFGNSKLEEAASLLKVCACNNNLNTKSSRNKFRVFNGELKTSGGRVLNITVIDGTLRDALDCAYEAAQLIQFAGMQYRRDIGAKALATVH